MADEKDKDRKAREALDERTLARLEEELAADREARTARVEGIPQEVWDRAVKADEGEGEAGGTAELA